MRYRDARKLFPGDVVTLKTGGEVTIYDVKVIVRESVVVIFDTDGNRWTHTQIKP